MTETGFNPQRDAAALATCLQISARYFCLVSIPNGTPPPLRRASEEDRAYVMRGFNPQRDAAALATYFALCHPREVQCFNPQRDAAALATKMLPMQ